MRRPNPLLALLGILVFVVTSLPSSFELAGSAAERPIRWPAKTIQIALSTSLTAPSPALKPNADVLGAIHRALQTWSRVAGVTFFEVPSQLQSISPAAKGDGVSLITIAGTEDNLAVFAEGNTTARTRVFYDPDTAEITEADIVINPYPYSQSGAPLQFSTDETAGTYDLESTLAHELGHLLGLSHSHVIGATMQTSQALNGTYGRPAITERTLSEADETAVRSLYDLGNKTGSIEGRILNSIDGNLRPAAGAHVWFEDVETGKVVASSVTALNGRFTVSSVPNGNYRAMIEYLDDAQFAGERKSSWRAFRSVEMRSRLRVGSDKATPLTYVLVPPQNSAPTLNPRFLGVGGELSTVPVPVVPGEKITLYVGGEGVDRVPGTGFVLSSPHMTIDAASLSREQIFNATPVISIEVTISANAPVGEYTLKLQANSGETAYLVGGLTVVPAN
jgi:Matrixin